jgi:hypothetical protein
LVMDLDALFLKDCSARNRDAVSMLAFSDSRGYGSERHDAWSEARRADRKRARKMLRPSLDYFTAVDAMRVAESAKNTALASRLRRAAGYLSERTYRESVGCSGCRWMDCHEARRFKSCRRPFRVLS